MLVAGPWLVKVPLDGESRYVALYLGAPIGLDVFNRLQAGSPMPFLGRCLNFLPIAGIAQVDGDLRTLNI